MLMCEQKIPNFLGIGAPKSATTWLAESLRQHPNVFMPHGKELVYFSSETRFSFGREWYLSNFSEAGKTKAVGEFSVPYLSGGAKVASRIFSLNPDIKLIVILRNPVERAFSHYRWLKQFGKIAPGITFLDAMKQYSVLIDCSLYGAKLEEFLDYFDRSQFFITTYDSIKENPLKVLEDTYSFVGVDQKFIPSVLHKRIGKTISPRSRLLEDLRIQTHKFLRRNRLMYFVSLSKKWGLSSFYRKVNDAKTSLHLDEKEYSKAFAIFRDDLAQLSKKFDIVPKSWLM